LRDGPIRDNLRPWPTNIFATSAIFRKSDANATDIAVPASRGTISGCAKMANIIASLAERHAIFTHSIEESGDRAVLAVYPERSEGSLPSSTRCQGLISEAVSTQQSAFSPRNCFGS
jgi:hypothetical protein